MKIKGYIQEKEGIAIAHQCLTYGGVALDDPNKTLADYDVFQSLVGHYLLDSPPAASFLHLKKWSTGEPRIDRLLDEAKDRADAIDHCGVEIRKLRDDAGDWKQRAQDSAT